MTNNILVLDVEADVRNCAPYNVGYVISDRNNVLKERSFALTNHFRENAFAMYARENYDHIKKHPNSYEKIYSDDDFVYEFRKDMEDFNVKEFYAYNVKFDWDKIGKLTGMEYLKEQFGEPKDIMTSAFFSIMDNKNYLDYCRDNDYKTEKGYPQATFETVYKYYTKNQSYEEVHRGLEDARDEYDLLRRLGFESKKGWNPIQPWRRMGKI